jgi:hypothetical protein
LNRGHGLNGEGTGNATYFLVSLSYLSTPAKGRPIMTGQKDLQQAQRESEAAKTKEKEGSGSVANVAPGQDAEETEQLKKAAHELEEEKGDWAKGH